MSLSHTEIGPFHLYTIETGRFRLDGGAMFGVVPKTLWSRQIEVDEKNRIPMAMRCLLIESKNTGRRYLVDTGIGTKFGEKMEKIYEVDHNHSTLEGSLKAHGFGLGDITDVIFTHLHFDHCGGTTQWVEGGENTAEVIFPAAQFHVTAKHWETANNPNKRETASFFEENRRP
ncbi:MAG: MBL fold metallo-hydrolase [Balneolaceae bacterium]|nr:MBL fold metallo-hydrolase [Balneolaceae bacterium]